MVGRGVVGLRIFVAPELLVAGEVAVRGDEHHYVGVVRRARVGDAVELVDGAGRRASGEIVAITGDETRVRVAAVQAVVVAPPHVRVLVPWIKGERMDQCLEKLVEVGADAIVVWPAARGVVKLDRDRLAARIGKARAAAQAAARQSGRAAVPLVTSADSLVAAVAALPADGLRFALDPCADRAELPSLCPDVTFASGPEGGFTSGELDALFAAGFAPLGLGPRTLRAETAPVVAVALVRAATRS